MDILILLLGCIVWVPLAVWIVSLVHWMITLDVDLISGVVGIFVAVTLGYVTMNPPKQVVYASPLAFLAVLVTVVMYPFVQNSLHRRELRSIEIESLEKAYDALSQKPNNPVARFRVARQAYRVGLPGHALAIAESALAYLPEQHFRDEHRQLKQWKASVTQPDHFRPIPCAECGTLNPPGNIHCASCGAPFLLDRARGKVTGMPQGRKLLAAWVALVAVVGVIPASTALPPLFALAAIVALLAASGVIVYIAFRGGEAAA